MIAHAAIIVVAVCSRPSPDVLGAARRHRGQDHVRRVRLQPGEQQLQAAPQLDVEVTSPQTREDTVVISRADDARTHSDSSNEFLVLSAI